MRLSKIKALAKVTYEIQKVCFKLLYFYLTNKKALRSKDESLILLALEKMDITTINTLVDNIFKNLIALEIIKQADYEKDFALSFYNYHIKELQGELKWNNSQSLST